MVRGERLHSERRNMTNKLKWIKNYPVYSDKKDWWFQADIEDLGWNYCIDTHNGFFVVLNTGGENDIEFDTKFKTRKEAKQFAQNHFNQLLIKGLKSLAQ